MEDGGGMTMQNQISNTVYVVSLGAERTFRIARAIEIVTQKER